MGCGAMNNGLNKSNGKEKCTRTFTRIEKAQFLLRKLTPALIGADECARVSDGSAPYVSRKTTRSSRICSKRSRRKSKVIIALAKNRFHPIVRCGQR